VEQKLKPQTEIEISRESSWIALEKSRVVLSEIGELINETKREQEQYEILLQLQEVIVENKTILFLFFS
jgi:hypothetical protein